MGSPFDRRLFAFLLELEHNNDKTWFEANKGRYEAEVREPALAFIRQMAPHVRKVSKRFVALDKKVGGSLMRVHRDVRFSKDKRPYKTNVGIQFRHERGKDVHAPGLYLHLAPEEVFLGVGMWHPDKDALAAVREAIVNDPGAWKRARDGKAFRAHYALGGESLARPPRGFDPEHPHIEDLKRKDHIAVCSLRPAEVSRADFVDRVAERFLAAKGYLRWQAKAVGLEV